MTDLSEFEKRNFVSCDGCSAKETVNYLERASAVSAVMTAYTKCDKESSLQHISGRKTKRCERDKRELIHIVVRKRRQSLSQKMSEINSISSISFQERLSKGNLIYGTVAIRKPLLTSHHIFCNPMV